MQKYFQTQNAALALALHASGIPFETDEQNRFAGCRNVYDKETLGRLGYSGWALEDAVRAAIEAGQKGKVTWSFLRTDHLDRAIKAWDEQNQVIDDAEATNDFTSRTTLDIEVEDAARLLAIVARKRKWILNLWRDVVPLIYIPGKSRTRKEGKETVTTGSFKIVSLNASDETRKHIGLN